MNMDVDDRSALEILIRVHPLQSVSIRVPQASFPWAGASRSRSREWRFGDGSGSVEGLGRTALKRGRARGGSFMKVRLWVGVAGATVAALLILTVVWFIAAGRLEGGAGDVQEIRRSQR